MVDRCLFAADHHAIAALEAPDAARGADIDIVHAFLAQGLGTADVVLVEAVAAVDDDVAARISPETSVRTFSVIAPAGSISQTREEP